jgi:hypothetical protein
MKNEKDIHGEISDIKADIADLSVAADNTWSGCVSAFAVYDTQLARIEERIDLLTEAYKSIVDLVNAFTPKESQDPQKHTRLHVKGM